MRAEASPMRADVLVPCRGTACCAPARQDVSFKQDAKRDGFERVSSLGGRSFSSDIKHPRPWALAPEESLLSFTVAREGNQ
jgi:hypothetical protein